MGRGAHPVAVVSYNGVEGLFGGDPAIVGKQVVLNGQNYSIVGVVAEGVQGNHPDRHAGAVRAADAVGPGAARRRGQLRAARQQLDERHRPAQAGRELDAANDRMKALVAQLRIEYPERLREERHHPRPAVGRGHPPDDARGPGGPVVGGDGGGADPAARGLRERGEPVPRPRPRSRPRDGHPPQPRRASRGARAAAAHREPRLRGGRGGRRALVAQWAITLANQITLPFDIDFRRRPAPQPDGARVHPRRLGGHDDGVRDRAGAAGHAAVAHSRAQGRGAGRRIAVARQPSGLVVAQMALSIILLVSAGLFLRNLKAATAADKGFVSDHVLVAEMDPSLQGYTRARTEEFYRRWWNACAPTPAVREVALAASVPLGLGENDTDVEIPGYVPAANENMGVQLNTVSPGYFAAMGIPVKGRGFLAEDDSAGRRVMVVNQQFVDHFFGGKDPIGQVVKTRGADHTIIGVVPTGKYVAARRGSHGVHVLRAGAALGRREWSSTSGPPATRRRSFPRCERRSPRSTRRCRSATCGRWRSMLGIAAAAGAAERRGAGHLRPARPGAGGHRDLRRDGVLGGAAHAGDRHPDGHRRRVGRRRAAGHAAGDDAGGQSAS